MRGAPVNSRRVCRRTLSPHELHVTAVFIRRNIAPWPPSSGMPAGPAMCQTPWARPSFASNLAAFTHRPQGGVGAWWRLINPTVFIRIKRDKCGHLGAWVLMSKLAAFKSLFRSWTPAASLLPSHLFPTGSVILTVHSSPCPLQSCPSAHSITIPILSPNLLKRLLLLSAR